MKSLDRFLPGTKVFLKNPITENGRYISTHSDYGVKSDTELVVEKLHDSNQYDVVVKSPYKGGLTSVYLHSSELEIISNKMFNNMNLFEKIALARKGEPEKSFIKAGIIKMDGSFTPEGQSAFLGYLLEKNGAAFKTDVVDAILAEDAKKEE